MNKLVAFFDNEKWESPQFGVREKRVAVGRKAVRVLEINGEFNDEEWCVKGHTGYVLDGSFSLNIDGLVYDLNKGDVFDVSADDLRHRHVPFVEKGGNVTLLLIEESE